MPVVVRTGEFRFIIHPNDHNPPHVHVRLSSGEEYRINLLAGDFMEVPPRGMRRRVMRAYLENVEAYMERVGWLPWGRSLMVARVE